MVELKIDQRKGSAESIRALILLERFRVGVSAEGIGNRLGPVFKVELLQQAINISADRARRDKEPGCNVSVVQAAGD